MENIFKYAKKELSQDAVITCILQEKDANAKEFIKSMLGTDCPSDFGIISVSNQEYRIDVFVEIKVADENGEHLEAIIIEDKTNTFLHDDQLNKYIDAAEKSGKKNVKKYNNVYFVLFKTGDYYFWEKDMYAEMQEVYKNNSDVFFKTYLLTNFKDFIKLVTLGYTQTNAVFPFRLEKIVEIDNLNIPRDNVKGRIDFDLDKYINENPYLLGGDITSVEMNISKDAIGEIIDAFGKDFSLLADYGDMVKIRFYASLADAFDWIKRFGNIAEVVSPQCLRNKIREYCSITYDKYCISDDDRYSKELTDEFERNDHHVLRLENIDLRNKNEYKNYKDVKKLILKNNNLTDVSFLSEFKNLTSLTIDNNPIEDFGFLAQMTELKELTILNLEGVDERYIKHEKEYDLSVIYNIWGLQLLTVSPEIASDLNVLELKRSCPNLQIKIDGIQGGFISIIEMIDLFTRNVDIDKLEVIISRFPIRRRDVYLDIESKEIAERAVEFAKSKSVFTEEDLHNSLNFKSYENRPPKMLIDWMLACEYIERIAANVYKFIG